MKAFILCGGFGTRLRNMIGATQKAVADVAGRPFLQIVVDQIKRSGIHDLVFCTHYQSDQVEAVVRALAENSELHTTIVHEDAPLGTGGAILNALHVLAYEGRFIALNADTYLDADAYRLAAAAEPPFLLITEVDDSSRYGSIQIDDAMHVVSMREKGRVGPGLISTGVYGLNAAVLRGFPLQATSMENDVIPQLIAQGRLQAGLYRGIFLDIGTPESLMKIREEGVREK